MDFIIFLCFKLIISLNKRQLILLVYLFAYFKLSHPPSLLSADVENVISTDESVPVFVL